MSSFKVKSVTYNIINGPNRDAIYDAMKYQYEIKIPIKFMIEKSHNSDGTTNLMTTRNLIIASIEHESGTGYDLNLAGFIDVMVNESWHPYRFKIYYNVKTRKGHITLIK